MKSTSGILTRGRGEHRARVFGLAPGLSTGAHRLAAGQGLNLDPLGTSRRHSGERYSRWCVTTWNGGCPFLKRPGA